MRRYTFPLSVFRFLAFTTLIMVFPLVALAELSQAELTNVKSILRSRCAECHSAEASVTDFDILDVKSMIQSETIKPGNAAESRLIKVMVTSDEAVRMPQDLPEVPSDEIDKIRNWIQDGAKPFPSDVAIPEVKDKEKAFAGLIGVEHVLKSILAHQRQLPSADKHYFRYFSCNHLLTRGATREELNVQRDAFLKVIHHLTYQREVVPAEVVDGETASVFAVDIRRLGWHNHLLAAKHEYVGRKQGLDTYDLLLLEYPYGIGYDDSDTYDDLYTEFIGPSGMVRQIPYLRVDWFCSASLQPNLYHDIMKMPHDVAELEREIVGVDAAAEMHHSRVKRGAVILSGVSRNNRAAERYESPLGAYWKSIDYATNKGQENIFRDPVNLHGVGGEMIFNLPNGLQGYYLANGQGGRIDAGPTEIVTDKFSEDKIVRNALSCIRCHDRGMKSFRDVVRPAVEMLPGHLGFSKRDVLQLYPERDVMDALLKKDSRRFMDAMEKVLGHPQVDEPLTPVTRRFLEDPLTLATVAGELGLAESKDMAVVFRSRQFAALGLVPLASRGAIRRDTWENYFDQVVYELGIGRPVIPLDAVSVLDYAPLGQGANVNITTTRGSQFFAAGDEMAIILSNDGQQPAFVELIGTDTKGQKVVLVPAGTKIHAGQKLRFPSEGTLTVRPQLGRELITVYASDEEFDPGIHFTGENVADRYVHDMRNQNTSPIVKKTLVIETR